MDRPVFIFAGSYAQAEWLARKFGFPKNKFRYLSDPYQLHGTRKGTVLFFGTWRDRRNEEIDSVKVLARNRGLTILMVRDI